MAASPGDQVYDPNVSHSQGLAQYKNSYAAKVMSISEACKKKLKGQFCLEEYEKNDTSAYRLKQQHYYYYQIQCRLCKQWCDFVVRTEKDILIERMSRNKNWWNEQIAKLKTL